MWIYIYTYTEIYLQCRISGTSGQNIELNDFHGTIFKSTLHHDENSADNEKNYSRAWQDPSFMGDIRALYIQICIYIDTDTYIYVSIYTNTYIYISPQNWELAKSYYIMSSTPCWIFLMVKSELQNSSGKIFLLNILFGSSTSFTMFYQKNSKYI